jgi:hypothetical protein
MGKKSGSGSEIRDEQPGSYFLELRNHFFWVKIIKFFDVDPGWKKVGSAMEKSRIRDKHPGSATLVLVMFIGYSTLRYLVQTEQN